MYNSTCSGPSSWTIVNNSTTSIMWNGSKIIMNNSTCRTMLNNSSKTIIICNWMRSRCVMHNCGSTFMNNMSITSTNNMCCISSIKRINMMYIMRFFCSWLKRICFLCNFQNIIYCLSNSFLWFFWNSFSLTKLLLLQIFIQLDRISIAQQKTNCNWILPKLHIF